MRQAAKRAQAFDFARQGVASEFPSPTSLRTVAFHGGFQVPLVSVSKAAKLFQVSRPTLQKALKDGTITGEKVMAGGSESWQIDTAELARIYSLRKADHDKEGWQDSSDDQRIDVEKPDAFQPLPDKLDREVENLRAELEKVRAERDQERVQRIEAQAVAAERKRLLDEMVLLPRPDAQASLAPSRGFWSRWRRR